MNILFRSCKSHWVSTDNASVKLYVFEVDMEKSVQPGNFKLTSRIVMGKARINRIDTSQEGGKLNIAA